MNIISDIVNLPYDLIVSFGNAASLVFGTVGTVATAVGGKISIYIVPQQEVAIVERLGKYRGTLEAGLHFRWPAPIERIVSHEELRQTQHNFEVNVQTSDHAMVDVPVALLLRIIDPYNAYYVLDKPIDQIEALIGQSIKSIISKETLDKLFANTDELTVAVKSSLGKKVEKFGYAIEDVVVAQPKLKPELIETYDRVVQAQKLEKAAEFEGEATRIKAVKIAEGEKEAMGLRGEGLADLQKKLSVGIAGTVQELTNKFPNISQEAALAAAIMLNSAAVTDQASQSGQGNVVLTSISPNDPSSALATLTSRLKLPVAGLGG